MNQEFDAFGQPEIPYIILCNPNKQELYSLGLAYNTKITKRFNAISEFSFSFPKSIDGGITNLEAYDYIQNKRLIEIEGYGWFQIVDPQGKLNGAVDIKEVSCQSLEVELVAKRVTAYGGTKKLYDPFSPDGTVLQDMIELAPNWSIGEVDGALLTLYRTFNVSDTNVYAFLSDSVSKAFECVFVYDTDNRTISAYSLDNATTETDIFLSFDNLISNATFTEKSDELVTALSVYGGGVLNIRNVNPLGTDKIYNFDYYKNSNWMSDGLITALNNWESIVATQQPIYADDLTLLSQYNAELLDLQATLSDYQAEYSALEGQKVVAIQAGVPYPTINDDLAAKQAQIDAQNVLISNKQMQIDDVTAELQSIHNMVSFSSNFTEDQLLELDNFIFENTYKNENIIQTDSMTAVEIQAAAQSLYDQGKSVLSRVSQPRYEFSLSLINYIDLQEFEVFTQQTELGCEVTAELEDGEAITTVLLEISQQFDDPSQFSMTFSNRLRLDNGAFIYSDLMGQVVKTGSAVAFDSLKWSNWESDYKDPVTKFITSSLNAAVNNLVSSTNQDIIIDQNGLRGRQFSSGSFGDKQVWLVNNMLAFSDDAFQTAKLALGEITLSGGGTAFGLAADVIVGRMLAGNSLTITNSGNNFTLDSTGATLTNAKFSIQTTNTKVIIDPTATNSFVIQKNEGGTFNNKFWVDNSGNVNFAGNLTGATGTFSGTLSASVGNIGTLVIDSNGLKTADGNNYLRGNGDFKWGQLSIAGGSATFTGTIYANNIVGQINNGQISDGAVTDNKINTGVNAGKVTLGNMSGSRIYGGTISGSGMSVSLTGTGVPTITGTSGVSIAGGGGSVNVGSPVVQTSTFIGGSLQITGSIFVSGGTGQTTSRAVNTPLGTRTMTFSNGILTSFT